MTLRTPRRRISPRTKRRYRAIREFFRRALGSTSQQDIKINSSIAVNVTDLKHKILGIENQLTAVSKHCRDLVCLDTSIRKGAENFSNNSDHNIHTIKEQTEVSSEHKSKSSETKVLYKNNCRRSDESDYATLDISANNDKKNITPPNMYTECHSANSTKVKKKKIRDRTNVSYDCDPNLRKHKAQSAFDTVTSMYSTSYHSVAPVSGSPHVDSGYTKQRHDKKHVKRREYIEHTTMEEPRYAKHKENTKTRKSDSPSRYIEDKHRSRKAKRGKTKIDEDFIADIIKRQYKPVKLFGRRDSDMSQISAPVCRDQEFSLHEDIQEGEELCSCCYDAHNHSVFVPHRHHHELSDMRSICDTRLYSSKRNSRVKRHRQYADIYNDAALYDLVPVKEKSSPKTRRKFVEDHMTGYNYYKEVPPSPRTQRPRLNLKAQYYTEYDDYMVQVKPNRRLPQMRVKRQEYIENLESDITSEIILPRNRREKHKIQKHFEIPSRIQVQQEVGTMSRLPSPRIGNEQNNDTFNETLLNKTQDTDVSVKTDKALCEIKDILQSFLQEIKKEATTCDNNKEINNKTTQKHSSGPQQNAANNPAPMMDSGQNNFNNQSIPQCTIPPPFMPPFQNTCCYPILPICPMNPMNCMQNGYIMPSPSFTCHACSANTKETVCHDCSNHKIVSNESRPPTKTNETDELIKEIYKFVAQSPNCARKKVREDGPKSHRNDETKELTSRSVGASSRISKHDAQVGTPTMKCYSKSCEAIGSRMITDTSYTTTQSDTVLEKLSLEVTRSMSDSELSSESTVAHKRKRSRFAKVLQSIGLLKKKKKDIIEEISESESSVEVEVKPKTPFRQEITNYTMHGQEYFNRPPVPPYARPERPYGYGPPLGPPPGYDPRAYYANQTSPHNDAYPRHSIHRDTIPEQGPSRFHHEHRHPDRHGYPSAPPYPNYDPHCSHQQPQVPLCLKEIEVKSTGTQSDRKMSFLQKLAKKQTVSATARSDPIKNNSTQTPQNNNNREKPEKPGLFTGWKNQQAKGDANINNGKFIFKNPKGDDVNTNPLKFSFKTQKQLAEGDVKMRNAMLKKLFYKRNPFSPRNLIVRTLMGKDQSSYGEPQVSFRPRMFF